MFSLIITIISIALVAALALATLYYGGKAFNKGSASADATKLHVQAQQLQGAAELYKVDTGAYPLTLQAMLDGKYLTSVPVASLSPETAPALMGTANAAATPWVMVLSGYPVFAVTQVSEAVCKSINLKAYGQEGILKTARTSFVTQCYGTDVNNLKMVTTKTGAMLTTVAASPSSVIALGSVISDAVPATPSTDTSAAGWLVAPGSVVVVAPPVAPTSSFTITASTDFGLVAAYYESVLVMTLTNTGSSILQINDALMSSPNAHDPHFVSTDCPSRSSILAWAEGLMPSAMATSVIFPTGPYSLVDSGPSLGAAASPWGLSSGQTCHITVSMTARGATSISPAPAPGTLVSVPLTVQTSAGNQSVTLTGTIGN
jgi:hypothetical protein